MNVAAIVISGAALILSGATLLTNQLWEGAKLSRSERATAYGALIAAESERWEAYRDRDQQDKAGRRPGGSPPTAEQQDAVEKRIRESRTRAFDALTLIRLLGSSEDVIRTADAYHQMMNRDNHGYRDPSASRIPGADRKRSLWEFVHAAREDLEHPVKRRFRRRSPLPSPEPRHAN